MQRSPISGPLTLKQPDIPDSNSLAELLQRCLPGWDRFRDNGGLCFGEATESGLAH